MRAPARAAPTSLPVDTTPPHIDISELMPAVSAPIRHPVHVAVVRTGARGRPLHEPTPEWAEDLDGLPHNDDPHFGGVRDSELLEPLLTGELTKLKFNYGGSSLSYRADFDNGARAAFKPDQTNNQSTPRKEIAAYRINVLLGLDKVQPAIGRQFTERIIYKKLARYSRYLIPRMKDELVVEDKVVNGALSWWIPEIDHARIDGYTLDSTKGIGLWESYLKLGNEIPEESFDLLAQISKMLLFDFIINNPDRLTGGNCKASPDGATLYFMDNSLSFSPYKKGVYHARENFKRAQKFSRSLVRAVRAMTEDDVRAALEPDRDPFEYLLSDREIEAVMGRRAYALDYIDELINEYGESDVLAFP